MHKRTNISNYNKTKIAKNTGISRATVSAIFNKKLKNPRVETVKKLAFELNCTVDDILNFLNDEQLAN